MNNTLPRRRLRFSLRTLLLVVTLVAIPMAWVGYQLNWIQQRNAVGRRIEVRFSGRPIDAPGLLWLFGVRGYREVQILFIDNPYEKSLTDAEAAEVKRISRLFPEAERVYGTPTMPAATTGWNHYDSTTFQ